MVSWFCVMLCSTLSVIIVKDIYVFFSFFNLFVCYLSLLKINIMLLLQVPSCFGILSIVFNRNFK